MPFLNEKDRNLVKTFLDEVLTDKGLQEQLSAAESRKNEVACDYTLAMTSQYLGILKSIFDERAKSAATPPSADARSPDIAALKKKFLGPEHQ